MALLQKLKKLFYVPTKTEVISQKRENNAAWRIQQDLTDNEREVACRRLPPLDWLINDFTAEAFEPRLIWRTFKDLEDEEGTVVSWQQDWEDADFMPDIIRAFQLANRDAMSAMRVPSMQLQTPPDMDMAMEDNQVLVFPRNQIELSYENKYGILTGYKLKEYLGRYHVPPYLEHYIPQQQVGDDLIGSGDFADVVLIIPRKHPKYKYEGAWRYESLIDVMEVIAQLLQSVGLKLIRWGSGMRIGKIFMTDDEDVDTQRATAMKTGLKKWESIDMSVLLEKRLSTDENGRSIEVSDEVDILDTSIDAGFRVAFDMAIEMLAGKTGIPKNRWIGIFQGETTGAVETVDQTSNTHVKERKTFQRPLIQFAKRWCETMGFEFPRGTRPTYDINPPMREKEQEEIEFIKAQKYAVYKQNGIMDNKMIFEREGWEEDPNAVEVMPTMTVGFEDRTSNQQPNGDENNSKNRDQQD